MKKYLALGLLSSLLLTSCSVDWNDEHASFKKKQECESYYDKMIQEWKWTYINELSLKEVFYSKQMNTCMYVVKDDNTLSISDYLSKKEVFHLDGPHIKCGSIKEVFSKKFEDCSKDLENQLSSKIKELKWE